MTVHPQFSPGGGYTDNDVEEESDAFLDAVRNGLDVQTRRLVRIIDNRFRTHARRMRKLELRMNGIDVLVGEVRTVKRLLIASPVVISVLCGLGKLLGVL